MSKGQGDEENVDFQSAMQALLGAGRAEAKAAAVKVLAGKEQVFADQPKAERWFKSAMAWTLENNQPDWYRSLSWAHKMVQYLYYKFRGTVVDWVPVLDTPRKALNDAERWLDVRGHLINYRSAIEVHSINEERDQYGEPGWSGQAYEAYFARIERQFGAANTLAYVARLTSNAILAYGNGLARILASFANELYAVGVKLAELVATVITVNFSNFWPAVRAFIKQLAALAVYFGNNAAAATINLDYTVTAMRKARLETTFLTRSDAMWPDSSRYTGFPLLTESGDVEKYVPRPRPVPQ